MPYSPPRPCSQPGCKELVTGRGSRCQAHRREGRRQQSKIRREDPAKRAALAFYNSKPWRAARALHLADSPLCVMCKDKGRLRAATVVDHIQEIKAGGDRFDPSNLQSLCASCHASKTLRDGGMF